MYLSLSIYACMYVYIYIYIHIYIYIYIYISLLEEPAEPARDGLAEAGALPAEGLPREVLRGGSGPPPPAPRPEIYHIYII